MSKARMRIPELDGLRVLMIFIVSWYHIWQQSWLRPYIGSYSLDYLVRSGYVWVDGTVLLSCFLLFLPWARAMADGTPAPDTMDFYYRRFRRIVPGYYFITLAVFFAIALPWRLYESPQFLVKDLATHLTFTFTFFYDTYVATPLGAAGWTLAILVQGYLLFPLIARGVMKKPAATFGLMAAVCLGFRAWCIWALYDYTMVVNQLINFLDVYILGIAGAIAYVRLEKLRSGQGGKISRKWQAIATLVFIGVFWGLLSLLRVQAGAGSYPDIQKRQMMYRPVYGVCFTLLALSAPFSLVPLRKLLGNPVTKFLGGISMNYYLIHQTVTVHLKRLKIPASESAEPHMSGELQWQMGYTALAFGISVLLAILVTYAVEKPAGKLLDRCRKKRMPEQPLT
ncbi:MAG: acyltransferase [Clostridia bacterium]|nr:acyltransferase [Clostridia bacterium]